MARKAHWVRLWATAGRGTPQTEEKWVWYADPASQTEAWLRDDAYEFVESTWMRGCEYVRYGYDDPVVSPPTDVRKSLRCLYRGRIAYATEMLRRIGSR